MQRPSDTSSVFDGVPDEPPSKNGSARRPGGSSPAEIRQSLQDAVPEAISTLRNLLNSEDEQVQLKAAVALCDRGGYGAKSTIYLGDNEDLEKLSDDESERQLLALIHERQRRRAQPTDSSKVVH
jgi:hypothetical protein